MLTLAKTLVIAAKDLDVAEELGESLRNIDCLNLSLVRDATLRSHIAEIMAHIISMKPVLSPAFDLIVTRFLGLLRDNVLVLKSKIPVELDRSLRKVRGFAEKYLMMIAEANSAWPEYFTEYCFSDKRKPVWSDREQSNIEFTEFNIPMYYINSHKIGRPSFRVSRPHPDAEW